MDSIVPYATLEEADAYFDDCRLNAESWEESTPENQLKALKAGTVAINRLSFIGVKATTTQINEFPRVTGRPDTDTVVLTTIEVIPDNIKRACCELALTLLDGVDPDLEEEILGGMSQGYAAVRVTSDPQIRKDHVKAGIPSTEAWKYLLPYLNDPNQIHLRKG